MVSTMVIIINFVNKIINFLPSKCLLRQIITIFPAILFFLGSGTPTMWMTWVWRPAESDYGVTQILSFLWWARKRSQNGYKPLPLNLKCLWVWSIPDLVRIWLLGLETPLLVYGVVLAMIREVLRVLQWAQANEPSWLLSGTRLYSTSVY